MPSFLIIIPALTTGTHFLKAMIYPAAAYKRLLFRVRLLANSS